MIKIIPKLLVAIYFSIFEFNVAYAQFWNFIITSKSDTSYYIDPASISKRNEIVTFTQLSNYPNGYDSNNKNIHSIQQVKEIDCKEGMIKTISMIAYKDEDAKGEIMSLSVGREYAWAKVNQNSISGIYKEEVCK